MTSIQTDVESSLEDISSVSGEISALSVLRTMNVSPGIFASPLRSFEYYNSGTDFDNFTLSSAITEFDFEDSRISWVNILNVDGPILLYDFDLGISGDCSNNYSDPTIYDAVLFRVQFNGLTYRWLHTSYIETYYQIGFEWSHSNVSPNKPSEFQNDTKIYFGRNVNFPSQFLKIDSPLFLESGIKIDYSCGHLSWMSETDGFINFSLQYKLV